MRWPSADSLLPPATRLSSVGANKPGAARCTGCSAVVQCQNQPSSDELRRVQPCCDGEGAHHCHPRSCPAARFLLLSLRLGRSAAVTAVQAVQQRGGAGGNRFGQPGGWRSHAGWQAQDGSRLRRVNTNPQDFSGLQQGRGALSCVLFEGCSRTGCLRLHVDVGQCLLVRSCQVVVESSGVAWECSTAEARYSRHCLGISGGRQITMPLRPLSAAS